MEDKIDELIAVRFLKSYFVKNQRYEIAISLRDLEKQIMGDISKHDLMFYENHKIYSYDFNKLTIKQLVISKVLLNEHYDEHSDKYVKECVYYITQRIRKSNLNDLLN